MPVTFTLDVEDHVPAGTSPRAPHVTRRILEFLERHHARATFFVVGELAEANPDLVREIAAAGHELGLHGFRHDPLTELTPDGLRDDCTRGKALLEDLSGSAVHGFRAPTFSLVPDSAWVPDVLAATGFTYSSSVLPARNPLYGWPGQPRTPSRWPSGIVELPCPVTNVAGRNALPYLGGVYLRVLPWPLVQSGVKRAQADEVLWTYCHPYDFDPDEPFSKRPELSATVSRVQWVNRRRMFDRVARLFRDHGAAPPLGERAAALA
jgi:polysaccharide deacetylase family protein (PEP-CTERM system associated)